MTTRTYTLHLNAQQAAVISKACEVLARLGIGQFRDALECLPLKEYAPPGWHEDMDGIAHILKKHFRDGLPPSRARHGVADESKTAWDLYQVVRHRLAWDENPEGDHMSVRFDQPLKTSKEPLAWIEEAK